MSIFLFMLSFLWVESVLCLIEERCPRKDPPPGVVVLSPGSRLDLSCSGHVMVNGVKVKIGTKSNKERIPTGNPSTLKVTTNSSFTIKDNMSVLYLVNETDSSITSKPEVRAEPTTCCENTKYPTSSSMVRSTSTSSSPETESDSEGEKKDTEEDFNNEEQVESIRTTKATKPKAFWMWNKKLVAEEDRNWGKIIFSTDGVLSLASVRLADAGNYSCYYSGREVFTVKVIVAETPEVPILSCYKKSPSSKIRCEWNAQKPVTRRPTCYLLLRKNLIPSYIHNPELQQIPCLYSHALSRCWCAIDNNDDELRIHHLAYLCVTNIAGNATSPPFSFTPFAILKPDPPSNVLVQTEQGQRMKVTWNLPASWKKEDTFYDFIYEIKYKPSASSNAQVYVIKASRSYTITDALPRVEYTIQLRNKEEYDGHWSDWSNPVFAMLQTESRSDESTTTPMDVNYPEELGSGFSPVNSSDESTPNSVCLNSSCEPSWALWVIGIFAVMSVILAAYIFRHRSKIMFKLQNLCVIAPHRNLSPPESPVSGAPEGEALMIFDPQLHKDCPSKITEKGRENKEGRTAAVRIEATHFNNKSYYFLEREL